MKLEDLLKRYGSNTTSNFDLMKIAKDLKIKPFYYVMKDEVEDLKNTKDNVIYVCTNLHDSDEPGVHHSCFVWDKSNIDNNYFFDSYGLPPVQEVKDLLEHATYNTFKIQKRGTRICGQLCMFVLHQLKNGEDFLDIILSLKNVD